MAVVHPVVASDLLSRIFSGKAIMNARQCRVGWTMLTKEVGRLLCVCSYCSTIHDCFSSSST